MQANLLLRGGRVVGHPAGTDILVQDGTIAAIGQELPAEAAEIVDAAGTVVMPGFVDTHRHLWQTSIRGVAADWSLVDYIRHIRLGYATAFRPEDVYISTLVGALEAIDAGITTLADFCHIIRSPEHADAARQALADSGLRARLYYGFYDIPEAEPVFRSHAERLEDAKRLRRGFAGADALLSMGLALTEFNLLPIADTDAEVALGRELDLDITMHMGTLSTPDGVTRLQAAGLLGPRMLHVHCNACTDAELRLISDSGGALSITPETEMQMGMGFPTTNRALAAGLAPTLGIDIVSDCSGDMVSQLRLALQTARAFDNQAVLDTKVMPTVIPLTVADAFRFATANGAAALGLDKVTGSLRVGMRADIVMLRTDGLHHTPRTPDPIATIVLQSRPGDVDTVLIDGVVRKRHGKMLGVDLAALAARAQASSDTIALAAAKSAANAAGAKMAGVYAAGVSRMTSAPSVSNR